MLEPILYTLPSRIRYEWKDNNLNLFIEKYNNKKLKELNKEELKELYEFATKKDVEAFNDMKFLFD